MGTISVLKKISNGQSYIRKEGILYKIDPQKLARARLNFKNALKKNKKLRKTLRSNNKFNFNNKLKSNNKFNKINSKKKKEIYLNLLLLKQHVRELQILMLLKENIDLKIKKY